MSCSSNARKIITPEQIDVQGFSVLGAVRVTAFGLTGTDIVTFQRVQYCAEQPNFQRDGCAVFQPSDIQIGSAVDYQIGECRPSLTAKRNTLIIPYAGSYIPVRSLSQSADLVVEVEPIEVRQFDNVEKGIIPCGLVIEAPPPPNYSASVPLPIPLNECGSLTAVGYLFHPNDVRDPKATIEIRDCENRLYGYAYPNAGEGHTLAIEDCDGVIGYAVNRSDTAPQLYGGTQCR